MKPVLHREAEVKAVTGNVVEDWSGRIVRRSPVAAGCNRLEMPSPTGRRLVATAYDLVEVDRTVRCNYGAPFDQSWLAT